MLLERHVCVATCSSDSLSDLNESSECMIWKKDLVFPVAAVAAVGMFVRSAHLGGIPLGLLLFKVHVVLGLGITCQTQAFVYSNLTFCGRVVLALPGPGAGAAVTAAGVFSNIMEVPPVLARSR